MLHTSASTFQSFLRGCEYLHTTAMIGSSNSFFTSLPHKQLLRQFATHNKQKSSEVSTILQQLSQVALQTTLRLFNEDYNGVVMHPLVMYTCNLYDVPIHSFVDFSTTFPLDNPPLDHVQPFLPPTEKIAPTANKRTNHEILTMQKAAIQRGKADRLKCLPPTRPYKESYLNKRRFLKPIPFTGNIQFFSSELYDLLAAKSNSSAVLGRVVKDPNSSKRFYQLGELYLEEENALMRCNWLECQYKGTVFPSEAYMELVEGAPLWNDQLIESPVFLFAPKAWEKGSFTMLALKNLTSIKATKSPTKQIKKKKVKDELIPGKKLPPTCKPKTAKTNPKETEETGASAQPTVSPKTAIKPDSAKTPASTNKPNTRRKALLD